MAYLTLTEAKKAPGLQNRLLRGTVLTVDPSSGGSSQPGYAITVNGVLQEYGILKLPKGSLIHHRLNKLCSIIQDLTARRGPFDVLILEKIAVAFGHQKGYKGPAAGMITQGVVHLHWSCGVVLAAYPWPVVIQVVPQSWHAWVRKQLGEVPYVKTDANDALVMTMCVYDTLLGKAPEGSDIKMLTQKD